MDNASRSERSRNVALDAALVIIARDGPGRLTLDAIARESGLKIAGAHREWLMQRCKKDFTVRGLVAELAGRGLKVDYRTMWEFVHAEKLSYKKRR